jgi:hypothetical protein
VPAQDDGRVLVDADAQLARVLRHGAQKAPDAAALREMLVNDDIPY